MEWTVKEYWRMRVCLIPGFFGRRLLDTSLEVLHGRCINVHSVSISSIIAKNYGISGSASEVSINILMIQSEQEVPKPLRKERFQVPTYGSIEFRYPTSHHTALNSPPLCPLPNILPYPAPMIQTPRMTIPPTQPKPATKARAEGEAHYSRHADSTSHLRHPAPDNGSEVRRSLATAAERSAACLARG